MEYELKIKKYKAEIDNRKNEKKNLKKTIRAQTKLINC
jgi:hypothetical protein